VRPASSTGRSIGAMGRLACVGDADFEANACQLQVLASQLDVLALDSRLGFGSEHADVRHARAEHDVEHVGEVAVLTPLLP